MRYALMTAMMLTLTTWAGATVPVVVDGRAQAVVVTADEPTPIARYAAEELVYHIERATGVRLSVLTEGATPAVRLSSVIYVGPCAAARAAGIDETALDNEQTVLRTDGARLYIVGDDGDGPPLSNDTRGGTLWGVYEVIERVLQARWLWPGELGTYVPRTDRVIIPDLNETIEPRLWQRNVRPGILTRALVSQPFTPEGLQAYSQAQSVFLRRHRMGRRHPYRYGHSFEDWWEKYGQEHPDWFQLLPNGKRGPASPGARYSMCVSNPGFHQEIIRLWQQERAERPDEWHNIRICENDIQGLCTCETCQSWDGPQPEHIHPRFGPRVVSDRYARFWKTIYELASAIDPNVVVIAYAYVNYAPPPATDIKLHPNIMVGTVPDLFFPRTAEHQQWVKDQWLGWRKTGCSLFLRPNYTLHGYVMPHNYAHQFADEFRFEWANNMVATDFDSLTGQWATQGSTLYALMRLHTQADREVDDILSEYYAGFGPAAEYVKRYFDYWEDYTTRLLERSTEAGASGITSWSRYAKEAHRLFPPECFEPALAILDQAKQATGATGEFAQRVDFLRLGLEHAMLCAQVAARVAGADPQVSPFAAIHALRKLNEFRRGHEGSFISNLHFAAFIEGRSWELPQGWDGSPVRAISAQAAPLEDERTHFSLRGGYTMLALLGEGEHFRARITTRRVGSNDQPITWVLVNSEDRVLERGEIVPPQSAELDIAVPAPGTYAFFVQTNQNNAQVTLLNEHAALAGRTIGFIYQTPRVYFWVPEGMTSFKILFSSSWPGEAVRVRVLDPQGSEVASAETTRAGDHPIEVVVPAGQDGKAWSLTFEKTDQGVLEDYRVTLGEGLPPIWAHAADRLVLPAQ